MNLTNPNSETVKHFIFRCTLTSKTKKIHEKTHYIFKYIQFVQFGGL